MENDDSVFDVSGSLYQYLLGNRNNALSGGAASISSIYANPTQITADVMPIGWENRTLALGAATLDPTMSVRPLCATDIATSPIPVGGVLDSRTRVGFKDGSACQLPFHRRLSSGAMLVGGAANVDIRFGVTGHAVDLIHQPTIRPIQVDSTAEELQRVRQKLEKTEAKLEKTEAKMEDLEDDVIRVSSQLEQTQVMVRDAERRESLMKRRFQEERKQRLAVADDLERTVAVHERTQNELRRLRREFRWGSATYPIFPPEPDDDFDVRMN